METTNPATPSEQKAGVYVYCIIESEEPRTFGKIGIGGRSDEVFTVHYRDLAAVVSHARFRCTTPRARTRSTTSTLMRSSWSTTGSPPCR